MTGSTRAPVVAIPFANSSGATVLCSDGSVWDLLYSDDGKVVWNDLGSPLPGSAAALASKPEKGLAPNP